MGAMLVALRKRGALVPGALKKISDADLRSDMVFASKVAATTCTREGADPPTAREMGWKNKE
jgi:fructokinase